MMIWNQKLDDQREIWDPNQNSDDVDMDVAGSEAPKEINKLEPQCQTPYEFSMNLEASSFQQPTSTVTHSVFPENSYLYDKMEGDILMVCSSGSVNGRDIYTNAKQITPSPGQNFNQNSDTFGLPHQQFVGISQDQLVNSKNPSDEHTIDFSGRVQENSSPLIVQNSIDSQHGPSVINHSMPQTIDDKYICERTTSPVIRWAKSTKTCGTHAFCC